MFSNESRYASFLTHPPQGETPEWKRYWKTRQACLGIETHDEELKPLEVLFCERMNRIYEHIPLCDVLEWLPRDKRTRSTSDFIWIANNGLAFELKSPQHATYQAAERKIWQAVTRALKHGVAKENFFIDYGNLAIPTPVLADLSDFNIKHDDVSIAKLWCMSCGQIFEVTLNDEAGRRS